MKVAASCGVSPIEFSALTNLGYNKQVPPMIDCVDVVDTYLAQKNFKDWLNQFPVHRPMYGHML